MKLKSLYINNYRCLQNFIIDFEQSDALLLLGRNGMGKTTVLGVLSIIHSIACGIDQVGDLFKRRDFAFGQFDAPMRFEISMEIDGVIYKYSFAVVPSSDANEVSILEEGLKAGDAVFFSRSSDGGLFLSKDNALCDCPIGSGRFFLALSSGSNRCGVACEKVRAFISSWLLVSPWPSSIRKGFSRNESFLALDASNFLSWFRSVIVRNVGFTDQLMKYLGNGFFKERVSFSWTDPTKERENDMLFSFSDDSSDRVWEGRFSEMSDGEKIFVIGAALMTCNAIRGGTFCFWDEPDNFLAISEVQGFITRLRKSFGHDRGQLVITSHNIETIRTIGIDATAIIQRASQLEPARIQFVRDNLRTAEERDNYIQDVLSGDIYGL